MFGLPPWLKGAPEPEPVTAEPDLIEPTAEEAKNGWTAETLTTYVAEREKARSELIVTRRPVKPRMAKSKYSPHRWRSPMRRNFRRMT